MCTPRHNARRVLGTIAAIWPMLRMAISAARCAPAAGALAARSDAKNAPPPHQRPPATRTIVQPDARRASIGSRSRRPTGAPINPFASQLSAHQPSARPERSADCAVGRTRISLTSTWGGWETANITARATSSGSSAFETGLSKNGVSTIPGSISVTRTPVPFELLASGLAHRRHRPLGGRVERSRQRPAAGHRAGQQQMAAGLLQRGDRGADRQRRAVDVGQHHRAPVLGRLVEEAARGAEAGVGEGDVEPPEAVERGGDHRLLLLPLGHVAADREGALGAAQLGRRAPGGGRPSGRRAPAGSRPRRRLGRWRRRCRSRRR